MASSLHKIVLCLQLLMILTNCLVKSLRIMPPQAFRNNMVRINSTQRVVGGFNVPEGEYIPYQVSLQYYTKQGAYQHFCGGSIIAPDLILTAAHCCQSLNASRMTILAGIRDFNDTKGLRSQVVSYRIHPRYEKLKSSDIAILHIDPPLPLNNVSLAAIPTGGHWINGGLRVTISGWGLRLPVQFPFLPTEWETINFPSVLQTMTYHTITNSQCRLRGLSEVSKTELCAHSVIWKGACSGDSGGPLVAMTEDGLQQVGIVSYGLLICGIFDVPDVYTRVSEFSDWIQEQKETYSKVYTSVN